jgi:ADP-ribose pyrophosphatase YjhB (NUDIX family)
MAAAMEAVRLFRHCPRCATGQPTSIDVRDVGPFRCAACGFVLYFSPCGAVATIVVRPDGQALFVRRAQDPAAGKLGMPGGFVDPGESAEAALRREVREEIGLDVDHPEYLCSHPNRYHYRGVTYATIDLFFVVRIAAVARPEALDGVEDVVWRDPLSMPLEELAFDSMRAALVHYRTLHPPEE